MKQAVRKKIHKKYLLFQISMTSLHDLCIFYIVHPGEMSCNDWLLICQKFGWYIDDLDFLSSGLLWLSCFEEIWQAAVL